MHASLRQCASCGSETPISVVSCQRCGASLIPTSETEPATIALSRIEPAANGPVTHSEPRPGSIAEEGRFIPGTLVGGRYRVIGLLGRGGMGEVYRATDLTLGQTVALKFLPAEASRDQRWLERFHNEVRTARQVTHPNVCRVYDIGEADGLPFISMEFVDGEDLASLLQRIGRLPSAKALEILRKLCAGVAAAHDRGVIHRDLKPQNIMLNKRGDIVIMDFGLAALTGDLSGTDLRSGTPAYMAPEQLRGQSVTFRSDLYALGLIGYELFTGARAFQSDSIAGLLEKQETSAPEPLAKSAPDVDPTIEQAILRCLQPDPMERPRSARALAAALPGGDPLELAMAAGETPSPEIVAASSRVRRFPIAIAVLCLAFVLIGVVACPLLLQPISLFAVAPMEYGPEVMEQKAYDLASNLARQTKRLDWVSRFQLNHPQVTWIEQHATGRPWRELFAAASPVEFWYRHSPEYLASPPDGTVDRERPAAVKPGMVFVLLDSRGRLRELRAVPETRDTGATSAPVEERDLFAAAGLDANEFQPTTPTYVPGQAFDERRAWTGPCPGFPDRQIKVEAASWRGSLTSFRIQWPWTDAAKPPGETTRQTAFTVFYLSMCAIGLFSALFFARRNLRSGRGDQIGARRVAAAVLLFGCVECAALFHAFPGMQVIGYAFERFAVSLLFAAILWVLYIALEPAVRARWPHTLTTWTRVLSGDWKDPAVASHILLGITVGVASFYLFLGHARWVGQPDGADPFVLGGALPLIAKVSMRASSAILWGSTVFFLLCGVRAIVRSEWAAIGLSSVIMTFVEGTVRNSPNPLVQVPLFIAFYVAFALMLTRIGLVPAIVSVFVVNIIGNSPVSGGFGAWFNWIAGLQLAGIAAAAIWSFSRSQSESALRNATSSFSQRPPIARSAASGGGLR